MANQWYYSENGQRRGPVPEEELKQRAASGQLKPTDKVWKKGMVDWQAVSDIEGLIPKPIAGGPPPLPWDAAAPSADEPLPDAVDPLPFLNGSSRTSPSDSPQVRSAPPTLSIIPTAHRTQRWATKAKAAVFAAAQRGKAAAQLVAKEAERTKLLNLTLPALYHALGKHIHGAKCFRQDFPEVYKNIDGLLVDIATLQAQNANAPKAEGLSAKAKAAAQVTKDMAHTQALRVKANHAITELGRAVFEKHSEQSAPAEVVGPIVECCSRVKKLDAEISGLSKSQTGQWFTPKRIAIGSGTLAALFLLFLGKWMFFGASGNPKASRASPATIRLIAKPTRTLVLENRGTYPDVIDFSPQGKFIVARCGGSRMVLSTTTWTRLVDLEKAANAVFTGRGPWEKWAISPDDTALASSCCLWDITRSPPICVGDIRNLAADGFVDDIIGEDGWKSPHAWSHDGRAIVSLAEGNANRGGDLADHLVFWGIGGKQGSTEKQWSGVKVPQRTALRGFLGPKVAITSFEPSPTENSVASISHDTLKVWTIPSGKLVVALFTEQQPKDFWYYEKCKDFPPWTCGRDVVFSADGSLLVARLVHQRDGGWDIPNKRTNYDIIVGWNTKTWRVTAVLPGMHFYGVSPDSKYLLTRRAAQVDSGDVLSVELWDLHSGSLSRQFLERVKDQSACFVQMCFSRDGKYLFAGGGNGTPPHINVWDIENGRLYARIVDDNIGMYAVSPDGQTVVTTRLNGPPRVWNLAEATTVPFKDEVTAADIQAVELDGPDAVTQDMRKAAESCTRTVTP